MRRRLPISGSARLAAVAVTTSALLATAGWSSAPAVSDPSLECPTAYTGDLVRDTPVTGLTVTKGTDPEAFTGTVLGVLENGIAPDLDMILVDLTNPTIDKVGIWSGMSGSPVYIDDQLVGAVSYSLGFGPSTIAGVTPAAEMQRMLSSAPPAATLSPEKVSIPKPMAARLVGSGAASASEVGSGMRQLRLPFGVSGLGSKRLTKLAPLMHFGDMEPTAAASSPSSSTPFDIAAGGNLVASMSYGTITSAAVGTATMVCGDEVVGFGHPMNFTGPATLALHGADAVTIQDDPTVSGFKVANPGAPIGTVDQDRVAGVHGVKGDLPASSVVTSRARVGADDRNGTSHVTVPEVFNEIAFSNMLAIQDRALNRYGAGAGWVDWTIKGTRKNGNGFQLTRHDLFADPSDISAATAVSLTDQLYTLQDGSSEKVTIDSVTTDSVINKPYESFTIKKVQIRQLGRWTTVRQDRPLFLRAGRNPRIKVFLTSHELPSRTVSMRVRVPYYAANRNGSLSVVGGNGFAGGVDEFYDEGFYGFPFEAPETSFPDVLASLQNAPQHNQVVATVHFPHAPRLAGKPHTRVHDLYRVVDGAIEVPVRAYR